MRYYNLDVNGWPRASFARPQPDKELLHLPDQPSEHHRWNGEQWVEDESSKRREQERSRIPELRESILDQIAMGETPDTDKRAEYKRLRQKHPRIAGEESAPLSDGAFTR